MINRSTYGMTHGELETQSRPIGPATREASTCLVTDLLQLNSGGWNREKIQALGRVKRSLRQLSKIVGFLFVILDKKAN